MDGSSPIPTINNNVYNKTFQYNLLAHLAKCEDLMKLACEKLLISDFELGVCQVVWEALSEYYAAYRQLPGVELRQLAVTKVVNNVEGEYRSYVTPEEHDALCSLMEFIDGYAELNPDHIKAELPKYIKWVRTSRAMSQFKPSIDQGADAGHMITQLAKIEQEAAGIGVEHKFDYVTQKPELLLDRNKERRITTGTSKLDTALDGGLRPGDIGCVTACPGVGKTNTLLHFSVAAASVDMESLVFSLELPYYKVSRRYIAMLAGVDAQLTKLPIDEWPEPEMQRASMVTDERYRMANKTIILDHSQKKIGVAEIEDTIGAWKAKTKEVKGTDENCLLVCVDWLKYILCPGSGKKDEWEVLSEVCQELGMVTKRMHVALWSANQGKAEADGKTLLRMKDQAFSYHIADALDVSIGIALTADSRVTEADLLEGGGNSKPKKLMFNINKSRENDIKAVELYQAPTLRFFDNSQTYSTYIHSINSGKYDFNAVYRASMPQHIKQLMDREQNGQHRTGTTG